MNNTTLIILISITIIALLTLVLFVAVSSARKSVKATFAVLCFSLGLWMVANTGADMLESTALWWTRVAFVGGALMLAALILFVSWFPRKFRYSTALTVAALLLGLVVSYLSLTSWVVPGVRFEDGYANVVSGMLYWVYILYIILGLILAISLLVFRLKVEKGANRERVKHMMLGVIMTASIASLTNLFIPLFTGANPLAVYGSLAAMGFIGMVAYSIIRNQLFSIRLATARAVAYLLSGASLAVFFGVFMLWLDSILFEGHSIESSQKVFYTFSAVIIGFSFPHIKRFFDKLTRSLLLRDMYEPGVVLKQVAGIISQYKKTAPLLTKVTQVIHDSLHVSFAEAFIHESDRWKHKASVGDVADSNRIMNIAELIGGNRGALVVLEHEENSIEGSVGMVLLLRNAQDVFGYITIGYKQNGTAFTAEDKSLLEAITNEVAVAAENSLRFEAIERFNETLQQKVEEATHKLRSSNKKLRLLDETKDDFISMASHQLRTPLTSIKGYLSMALDGDVGELKPEQRKILEEAFASSQRMVYLIGDFLNVSRLQTGKFELETGSVQLTQLLTDEIAQLRATATSRNITFVYDPPSNFPVLQLDENKIRQVMMNFIDNAIYYAKPGGGTIRVELARQADYVTFKVIDDGIGVPVGEQRHLFTKFYRATNARKARPDGTGIGLFMAKKVVVAHGGAILFESTEGKGSMFGFRLPVKAAQEATGQSAPAPRSAT